MKGWTRRLIFISFTILIFWIGFLLVVDNLKNKFLVILFIVTACICEIFRRFTLKRNPIDDKGPLGTIDTMFMTTYYRYETWPISLKEAVFLILSVVILGFLYVHFNL